MIISKHPSLTISVKRFPQGKNCRFVVKGFNITLYERPVDKFADNPEFKCEEITFNLSSANARRVKATPKVAESTEPNINFNCLIRVKARAFKSNDYYDYSVKNYLGTIKNGQITELDTESGGTIIDDKNRDKLSDFSDEIFAAVKNDIIRICGLESVKSYISRIRRAMRIDEFNDLKEYNIDDFDLSDITELTNGYTVYTDGSIEIDRLIDLAKLESNTTTIWVDITDSGEEFDQRYVELKAKKMAQKLMGGKKEESVENLCI